MRDADAYVMARGLLGGITEQELQFLLAVSRHETSYGDGWKRSEEAKRSNNMGAITEPDPSKPHFVHPDTKEDGTPITARFRVYPSKEAGLLDLALVLLKPNVRAALKTGDADAAVAAQRANKYFVAPLASYQAAVKRNHAALVKGSGIVSVLHFGSGGDLGLLLLLAAALWSMK